MRLLFQLKLFTTTLHNSLCFSIAFNIFVIGFTTGQLLLLMPHRSRATAGYAMAPDGRSGPPASHATVAAGRTLAAAKSWLAAPCLQSRGELH
jgi:hypothetical protein